MMPKRGCDVNTCEIAKFYRLNNNGLCQVISMTVPRRSELFQEDLYPDTLSDEHSITAEEWIEGTDGEPVLVSLKVSWFVDSHPPPPPFASIVINHVEAFFLNTIFLFNLKVR